MNDCPQLRDPGSALPLPLIFLFRCSRHQVTHPLCSSWEEGQCPATAKCLTLLEPDAHVGAGAGATAGLKAASPGQSQLSGTAKLHQLFARAELGNSQSQTSRSQLPRRLPTYTELLAN